MRTVFDHQIFSFQSYGGISRYVVKLARELRLLQVDAKILAPLHINKYLIGEVEKYHYGWGLDKFPPKTTRLFNALNRSIVSLKIHQLKPDILHETYYSPKSIKGRFSGRILTVYDMIHEKFSSEFNKKDPTTRFKQIAVSRADHIICISHHTKRDLCDLFSVPAEKVSVVHLGFDLLAPESASKKILETGRPYLLYVGSRIGYKNFYSTLQAVASKPDLAKKFDIVAFGGGAFTMQEQKFIFRLGFSTSSVRQVDGDDSKLSMLYTNAAAFIYPSLYEGFGLPPLEAMAHGCPVVASNTSSIPEVIGSAGQYFDPSDIDAQAEAISKVVFDESNKAHLIVNGLNRVNMFTWSRCAADTLEIYKKILDY